MVEIPVYAFLNPFTDRVKKQGGYHNCQHQSVGAGTGHASVDQFRDPGNHCEIHCKDGGCGKGINHAAFKDQIHVHQAVTEDGIAESERQNSQRKNRNLHPGAGNCAEQVGNDVEQCKGRNGQDGAASYPLQLLPQDGGSGAAVAVPENCGRACKKQRQVAHLKTIHVPQHPFAGAGKLHGSDVQAQ